MKKKIIFYGLLLIFLVFIFYIALNSSISPFVSKSESPEIDNSSNYLDTPFIKEIVEEKVISLDGKPINVEIVQTDEDRIKGLSGRVSLEADSGMLFIFESLDFHGIWMKDMNFPIDIIWMDENFYVVHIEKNVLPETFPEVFKPNTPSLYVLEVNSGFSDLNGINVGSKPEFLQKFYCNCGEYPDSLLRG